MKKRSEDSAKTHQKDRPMNTRFGYGYSDKRNCKQYTIIILAGTITWDQIEPYLTAQNAFIPGQVGLEDLQYRFALPGKDHPWHLIRPEDIRPTEAEPTSTLTASELAKRFAHAQWNIDWRAAAKAAEMAMATQAERAEPKHLDSASQEAASDEDRSRIRVRLNRTRKVPARTKELS